MSINLAELEMSSVAIEDLKSNADKSYKSLFQMSRMVDSSCRELLRNVYDYNAVGVGFPRYLLAPEWNECCSQFRSRLLIVSVDNDYVAVPLKLNQQPSSPWWYDICFNPVSLQGRGGSVLDVLQALSGYCVKSVVVGEDEMKDAVDNNYYNTAENFHSWMDKSKWRSKHGINKLSNLIEFRSGWYDGIESDISVCCEEWNKQRIERGVKPYSVKCDIAYARKRMAPFCHSFFCNGRMVGYMLLSVFERCAAVVAEKSIASSIEFCKNELELNDQDANLAFKQLGRYMQYAMHKDLLVEKKLDAVYYYGDVGKSSLKEFKEMLFKNKIWYNRYSLNEYASMLERGTA